MRDFLRNIRADHFGTFSMTLLETILAVASLWADSRGHSSTARLSTIVANDGGLLKRLEAGGGTTVATLDKFAVFLRDPANWGDAIPSAAADLLATIPPIVTAAEPLELSDIVAPLPADDKAALADLSGGKCGDRIAAATTASPSPDNLRENIGDVALADKPAANIGGLTATAPFSSATCSATTGQAASSPANPACSTGAAR
jgi:hypothetical protein